MMPQATAGLTLRRWHDDDAAALLGATAGTRYSFAVVGDDQRLHASTLSAREPYPQEGHVHSLVCAR